MELIPEIMASGTIRLKSRELHEKYGNGRSGYRIAKDGDLGQGTVYRLIDGDETYGVTLDTLLGYLIGLGMTREQIGKLTLEELCDISMQSAAK